MLVIIFYGDDFFFFSEYNLKFIFTEQSFFAGNQFFTETTSFFSLSIIWNSFLRSNHFLLIIHFLRRRLLFFSEYNLKFIFTEQSIFAGNSFFTEMISFFYFFLGGTERPAPTQVARIGQLAVGAFVLCRLLFSLS